MAASARASGSRRRREAPRTRRRRSSVADEAAVAASRSGNRAKTSITPSLCTVSDRTSRPTVTARTSTRHTASIVACPGPESSGITAVCAAADDPGLPAPLRALFVPGAAAGAAWAVEAGAGAGCGAAPSPASPDPPGPSAPVPDGCSCGGGDDTRRRTPEGGSTSASRLAIGSNECDPSAPWRRFPTPGRLPLPGAIRARATLAAGGNDGGRCASTPRSRLAPRGKQCTFEPGWGHCSPSADAESDRGAGERGDERNNPAHGRAGDTGAARGMPGARSRRHGKGDGVHRAQGRSRRAPRAPAPLTPGRFPLIGAGVRDPGGGHDEVRLHAGG